jgi:hypothetical protein
MQDTFDTKQVAAAAQIAIEGTAGTSSIVSSAGGKQVVAASATGRSLPNLNPPAGAAAAWRGVLWGRIEAMCEALQRYTLQVRSALAAWLAEM